ncbi:MAG TPA: hypothetical protein VFW83_00180, partial [Bryobacteraceae bacterium]|nr:hypothetical protein [Bryobacteraceae bacterium]
MLHPVNSGAELIREVDRTITATPALWWLGHSGFIIRFANLTFYIDPCFSDLPGKPRLMASPLSGGLIHHADMILSTHAHPGHLDAPAIIPMLEASPRAKLVLPRRASEEAHAR